MLYCVLLYCYLVEYNGTFNIGGYYEVNCLSSLPRLHRHCTITVYSIKGVAQLSLTGRSQHHITVLLVQYAHSTLETRYNALQYNANSVITRLQCWLPFRWELHPTTVSTAGRDAWSKICRPPALCNTRWNAAAAARSTLYMYVQRSSLQEGEGGVSNE